MIHPASFRASILVLLVAIGVVGAWWAARTHLERRDQARHRADSLRAMVVIRELGRRLDEPEIVACEWSLDDLGDSSATACLPSTSRDRKDSIQQRRNRALAVLETMGGLDTFAVPYLEARVRSATTPWVRNLGVELLGRAGRNLADIGTRLQALAALDTSAAWRNSLASAHLRARTPQAARNMATWIDSMVARRDRIDWLFSDLGLLGPRSRDLHDRVRRLLGDGIPSSVSPYVARSWRRSTLRALGWTRDGFWLPFLLEGLRDPSDWPSACAAAISLGNLGDTSALPELRAVAAGHWYEAVRESALVAMRRLEHGLPSLPPDPRASFLGYWYQDGDESTAPPDTVPPRGDVAADCRSLAPESLATLRYRRPSHSWSDLMENRTTLVQAVPRISCPLADGLVLGNDEGEWGGEIAWRSADGRITILDSNSIQAFHRLGNRLLAVNSFRHMGMHGGELLEITPVPGALPTVAPRMTLPGSLIDAWNTPDGGLYLQCSHGQLVLDPQGRPRAWPPLPR